MKVLTIATTTLALVTAASLAACTGKAPMTDNRPISEESIRKEVEQAKKDRAQGKIAQAEATEKAAAEKLARIGELLLMPEGFEYADEMFAKALEIDPTNNKALLYKAVTEPNMTLKGYIPRIESAMSDDRAQEGIDRLRANIKKLRMPEVSRFTMELPDGTKPFLNYHDIQRFLRETYLPALKKSAEKLAKVDVSKGPIQLNFTPWRMDAEPSTTYVYDSYRSHCSNDPQNGWTCQDWQYHWVSKPNSRNVYFVDKHDLKMLQSMMAGLIDSIRLGTAYSLKDSEYVIRKLKAIDRIRSQNGAGGLMPEDVVTVAKEFNDFLTLEKDHETNEVAKSSAQAIKNALELADLRAELCDSPARNEENALINNVCMNAETVELLQTGADALAGPTEVVIGFDMHGKKVKILTDLARVLQNPPKDLKALLPTVFNEKGEPLYFADPTLGGMFPKGDFLAKIMEVGGGGKDVRKATKAIRKAARHIKDEL